MHCPSCEHANPEGARFCNSCGSPLATVCPGCQSANPSGARFCAYCGTSIVAATPAATRSSEPSASDGAESGYAAVTEPVTEKAPSQRESFVSGRYRVKRFLGEGGKKIVYLVTDSMLQRDVAFSLIKTEGLDDTGVERIHREAQVTGRLGDHPHMVALYDIGDEDGQPYLVSQLMGGGDVEGLIEDAPGNRVPLEQAIQIGEQVCQALDYAHGLGIIHRDLKPGNIWMTGDGTAKLGDFGLAMSLDRTRLSIAGMIVGTVGYMPPEQAMGRQSDSRSDLYSLGATLYELVTGKQPFVGDDPVAIISQHLNTRPVAPSWHNPDVPRPLENLILRLLAKDPADRPQTAAEVREELLSIRRMLGQDVDKRSSASISDEAPRNPLDRLAGGVFVGRDDEMEQLRMAVDSAFSGNGQVILVSGEPGIGKTTLVSEVATYAAMRGAQVLWSRNYEVSGRPPYWAWIQLIRKYVHDRNAEQLRSELGSEGPVIGQIVSEIRQALPDLPEGPDLSNEFVRFQLFDGVATFLKNASQNQPLVLSLDDLHWADEPSLKLLEHVAREVRHARLLIIGTYRDVEVGRHHPLAGTLAQLTREHAVHRILLRGLERQDVNRYIELTAGKPGAESLISSVYRQTDGNPFFVEEIVRLLVSEGKFDELDDSRWIAALPQGVREVIGLRLDQLSTEANQALAAAAVIGREFDVNLLARTMERDANDVLELLDQAVKARIIRESDRLDHYQFGQEIIQETLYEEMSIAQRRRWNGLVARAIEDLYADNLAPYYTQLAHHYAAAGPREDADKAIDYARRAGARAMEQGAWELAIRHYETALSILDVKSGDDPVLHCELLLEFSSTHDHSGITLPSRIPLPDPPPVDTPGAGFSYTAYAAAWAAAGIARRANLPEHLARAALRAVGSSVLGPGPATIELMEEALQRLPDEDSELRAELLIRTSALIAKCLASREIPPEPEREDRSYQYAMEAEAIARRINDPDLLGGVLQRLFFNYTLYWYRYRKPMTELKEMVNEFTEIADRSSSSFLSLESVVLRVEIALVEGNRERAREILQQAKHFEEDVSPIVSFNYRMTHAYISAQSGDFSNAMRFATEGRRGQPGSWTLLFMDFMLSWQLDQNEQLFKMTQEFKRFGDFTLLTPLELIAKWEVGDRESVQRAIDNGIIEQLLEYPPEPRLVSVIGLLCYLTNDLKDAQLVYDELEKLGDIVVSPSSDASGGATGYYLGLISTMFENYDTADQQFAEALSINEQMDARPEIGQTKYAWADMLVRRGNPEDNERALELVDQALQLADELGMVRLERQALSLKVQVQGILKA